MKLTHNEPQPTHNQPTTPHRALMMEVQHSHWKHGGQKKNDNDSGEERQEGPGRQFAPNEVDPVAQWRGALLRRSCIRGIGSPRCVAPARTQHDW